MDSADTTAKLPDTKLPDSKLPDSKLPDSKLPDSKLPDSKLPEQCQTMADVRFAIDGLDRELVAMLALRQRYMDAAARIKPTRAHVRDEARIQDVLDKVAAEALKLGLSTDIALPVWTQLIEACIDYEGGVFDMLAASGQKDQ